MKTIVWKLIKDFRKNLVKIVLIFLATCLSAWGISSMVYTYFMTERDFAINFIETKPADMTLTIDNYQDGLIEKLLSDKNVIDIERREAISARVKNSQDAWMPITIYAVQNMDNMRYDKFKVLEDESPVSGILIERNSYYFLMENQDSISLQFLERNDLVRWNVTGKVHDARQAPSAMEGIIYAYATSINQLAPFLNTGRRRLLIKTNVSESKEQLKKVSERLKATIEASGSKVAAIVIPNPGEHIHQGIVDSVAFLQESGGITLSIMGIVLLSLILLTWVFPQVVDVGVMKAIGASTTNIFWSYTFVLLVLIFAGMIVGLPLGYKTALLYNNMVAFFQNFEVVEGLLPFPVHLLTILTGVIIPLGVGVLPLRNAAKTSVRESMDKTFFTPKNSFIHLSQLKVTNPRIKYIFNNLLRNTPRTVLTILLISVGIGLYFTATNTEHSIRADLNQFASNTQYELGVLMPDNRAMSELEFLENMPFLTSYLPVQSRKITYLPPTVGFPKISSHRILSPGVIISANFVQRGKIDKECDECIYISGEDMRREFAEVALETPIELTNSDGVKQTFIFSGVIRDIVNISAPFLSFNESVKDSFNSIIMELDKNLSDEEILETSNKIDDAFMKAGIVLSATTNVKMRVLSIMNHLAPTFLIIKLMGTFTIILGIIGLIIVLNLTLKERTREIGIMKAVGASRKKISHLLTQEFFWISLFSFFVGGLLAIPVTLALIDLIAEAIIKHPVEFRSDFILMTSALVIVLIGQTAFISIYSQSKLRKNARELLNHNF